MLWVSRSRAKSALPYRYLGTSTRVLVYVSQREDDSLRIRTLVQMVLVFWLVSIPFNTYGTNILACQYSLSLH